MAQVFLALCSSQWTLLLQLLGAYHVSLLIVFLMECTGYWGLHILRACVPVEHTKIYLNARDSVDLGRDRPQYCNSIHCPHERGDLWKCGIL